MIAVYVHTDSVRGLYEPAAIITGMQIVAVVGSPMACAGLCAPSRVVTLMPVATRERNV